MPWDPDVDDGATAADVASTMAGSREWPVPAGWLLHEPGLWYRFPTIGEARHRTIEAGEALVDVELDANELRAERAMLLESSGADDEICYEFQIDGEVVFRRLDPEWPDIFVTIAEALETFSMGNDVGSIEAEPWTGKPVQDDGELDPFGQI